MGEIEVRVWGRNAQQLEQMQRARENIRFISRESMLHDNIRLLRRMTPRRLAGTWG